MLPNWVVQLNNTIKIYLSIINPDLIKCMEDIFNHETKALSKYTTPEIPHDIDGKCCFCWISGILTSKHFYFEVVVFQHYLGV